MKKILMKEDLMNRSLHDKVEKKYDEISKEYDKIFKSETSEKWNFFWEIYDEITWRMIKKYLPSENFCDKYFILDAGGGTGKWTVKLANLGYNVILFDISAKMLNEAYKKLYNKKLLGKVEIKKGDITSIPYGDEIFDFVLCEGDVISYCVNDYKKAIYEIIRVTKNNGIIFVGVDDRFDYFLGSYPDNIEEAFNILNTGKTFCNFNLPIYTFTPKILREIFEDVGAQIVSIFGKPFLTNLIFLKNQNIKFNNKEKLKLIETEIKLIEEGYVGFGHLQVIAKKIKRDSGK